MLPDGAWAIEALPPLSGRKPVHEVSAIVEAATSVAAVIKDERLNVFGSAAVNWVLRIAGFTFWALFLFS